METKEQIRNLHNSLVCSAANFYRRHSVMEGLGEKHFDLVLKVLFDKLILAIFSTDFAEAKAAKEDLANMLNLQPTCDFMNRIDTLRRSKPVETSIESSADSSVKVSQPVTVETPQEVHIQGNVQITPTTVQSGFSTPTRRLSCKEMLDIMPDHFTIERWTELGVNMGLAPKTARNRLAYLKDLGLVKHIYYRHYIKTIS